MAKDRPPDPPNITSVSAGGLPASHLGVSRKTFASALSPAADAPTKINIPAPSTGLHKGLPSITFDDSVIQTLSVPFGWSLIGKFAKGYNKNNPKLGRPSTDDIKNHLVSMDFTSGLTVGLMDNRHCWIRFSAEEDFLRLYSRPVWYIHGMAMRVFRWTPYFRVDIESSLVPVWVKFPRLPIQFFQKEALFPIASLLGLPLRPDTATSSLKRPSVARIQIEIDLLKPQYDKIWITVGSGGGYWQQVEYEAIPQYCTHCMHVGHKEQACTVNNPELVTRDGKQIGQWVPKSKETDARIGTGGGNKIEVPISAKDPEASNTVASSTFVAVSEPASNPLTNQLCPQPAQQNVTASVSDGPIGACPELLQLHEEAVGGAENEAADSLGADRMTDTDDMVPTVSAPTKTANFTTTQQHTVSTQALFRTLRSDLSIINAESTVVEPSSLALDVVPLAEKPPADPEQKAASDFGLFLLEPAVKPLIPPARILPQTFQPSYNIDAFEDGYSSWRTVNTGDEDAEEEESDGEDYMGAFLDNPYVRDDDFLDQRRTR